MDRIGKIDVFPVKSNLLAEIIRDQEEAKRPLCDKVRKGLLEAIGLLADAANHPLIARRSIQDAHKHIKEAFKAALELDPIDDEPASSDWKSEHHEPVRSGWEPTVDQVLDDPRHGQAESINAGRF